MSLSAYLPQDRLRALANNTSLPDRTSGSALFADISGFTALTETLGETLGARRGAEEMSRHLNRVYNALISQVEHFGGSVIDIAGDSIMCWFDVSQGATETRATSCALALQKTMKSFEPIPVSNGKTITLAVKVVVTSGLAHRFVVGDPSVNYIDVLVGDTIARTSWGERISHKGEVLVDKLTAEALQNALVISEWRTSPEKEDLSFAVVQEFNEHANSLPESETSLPPLDETLKSWIHHILYEKEHLGQGAVITEFRPCTAMFLRFSGIDFDSEEAHHQLNELICLMQTHVGNFGGTLLQIIVGDKGSYAYINLGALGMYEDGPRRAVKLALALREATALLSFKPSLQIGITQGTMFVGPYGSVSRKTFGALGDDVNLCARLMTSAKSNEILISSRVRKALADEFIVEARPAMIAKGKAEPVPVYSIISLKQQRAIRLQEPTYVLPMIGREKELGILSEKLTQVLQSKGQILGITGEAGMGKSRLVSEGIRLATRGKLVGYGGFCKSDSVNTPYVVWNPIWNAFFDLDPGTPLRRQIRSIELEIEDHAPDYLDALPLLGPILGLQFPENDQTRVLQPKDRKSQLEAMLLKCLESAAHEATESGGGLLLVLEDMHWIDPVSSNLLDIVARAIADLPILIMLSYRLPEIDKLDPGVNNLRNLNHFTEIRLMDLNKEESEQIIRGKVMQLFPEQRSSIPQVLIERITHRAQGNPFYVEELLNFLHDNGIDPRDEKALSGFDLPNSLQSLILSRIDRLTPSQQLLFRVASIIGRVFKFEDLLRYYPWQGITKNLKEDLQILIQADLLSVDTPEPDMRCIFRHLVTHEVSYENIAYTTRVHLHGLYAAYLENTYGERVEQILPQLAYHFDLAQIKDKAAYYLDKSGELAAANFANDEALAYFNRALTLADGMTSRFKFDTLMKRERVYDLLGKRREQVNDLDELSRLASQFDDSTYLRAELAIRLARLGIDEGNYSAAKTAAQSAIRELDSDSNIKEAVPNLLVDALWLQARAMFYAGQAIEAKPHLDEALELAKKCQYIRGEYNTVGQLGLWYWYNGDNQTAHKHLVQSLELIRKAGDIRRELDLLNNLGIISKDMYMFNESFDCYEQAQRIAKKIGDRSGEATLLNNMGRVRLVSGDFVNAIHYCAQSASLAEEVSDITTQGLAYFNQGDAYRNLGQYQTAREEMGKALAQMRKSGYRRGEADALEFLARIEFSLGNKKSAFDHANRALAIAREINAKQVEVSVLTRIGMMNLNNGNIEKAKEVFLHASKIEEEYNEPIPKYEIAAGLSAVAIEGENSAKHAAALIEDLAMEMFHEPPTEQSFVIPMGLYLICLQVNRFVHDSRLPQLVARTKQELKFRSEKISDSDMRSSFLQIPEHQAILNFDESLIPTAPLKVGPISI